MRANLGLRIRIYLNDYLPVLPVEESVSCYGLAHVTLHNAGTDSGLLLIKLVAPTARSLGRYWRRCHDDERAIGHGAGAGGCPTGAGLWTWRCGPRCAASARSRTVSCFVPELEEVGDGFVEKYEGPIHAEIAARKREIARLRRDFACRRR